MRLKNKCLDDVYVLLWNFAKTPDSGSKSILHIAKKNSRSSVNFCVLRIIIQIQWVKCTRKMGNGTNSSQTESFSKNVRYSTNIIKSNKNNEIVFCISIYSKAKTEDIKIAKNGTERYMMNLGAVFVHNLSLTPSF